MSDPTRHSAETAGLGNVPLRACPDCGEAVPINMFCQCPGGQERMHAEDSLTFVVPKKNLHWYPDANVSATSATFDPYAEQRARWRRRNPRLHIFGLTLRFEFKLADCWIGFFWKEGELNMSDKEMHLWVCLIPCFPLHVSWFRYV